MAGKHAREDVPEVGGVCFHLSDGTGNHTLAAFCKAHEREYQDVDWPVPIDTFTDYAQWFQKTLVDNVEPHDVVDVRQAGEHFELRLSTGETVVAAQVVMAVGHTYFAYTPPVLRGISKDLVSHVMDHRGFECLRRSCRHRDRRRSIRAGDLRPSP